MDTVSWAAEATYVNWASHKILRITVEKSITATAAAETPLPR